MTVTPSPIPLLFVMGATNVGKSMFMETARACPQLGLVEVGKLMRAKYPPDYFKGQGAPAHTQKEAWQMMLDGIAAAVSEGKRVVVIDGQPRNPEQTQWAIDLPHPKAFLHLWCPPELREHRARNRDAADPAKLDLTLKRLQDDPRTLYDCLSMLNVAEEHVVTADTSSSEYVTHDELRWMVEDLTNGRVLL